MTTVTYNNSLQYQKLFTFNPNLLVKILLKANLFIIHIYQKPLILLLVSHLHNTTLYHRFEVYMEHLTNLLELWWLVLEFVLNLCTNLFFIKSLTTILQYPCSLSYQYYHSVWRKKPFKEL